MTDTATVERQTGDALPATPQTPRVTRAEGGQWLKGVSGNPGGRIRAGMLEVRDAARALSVEGIEILAKVMRNKRERGIVRVRAVEILLDRAWGRPDVHVTVEQGDLAARLQAAQQRIATLLTEAPIDLAPAQDLPDVVSVPITPGDNQS